MNRLKFLLAAIVVLMVTLGIYSCAKEGAETVNLNEKTDISTEIKVTIKNFPSKQEARALLERKSENPKTGDIRSNTASNCFPAPGPNTNCSTLFNQTAVGNLPAQTFPAPVGFRPACNDMKLTYDVEYCFDVNTSQWTFNFSNFSADIGNCPALQTWFNGLSAANQGDQIDIWEYQLSFPLQQAYIQGFFLGSGLPYAPCPAQTVNANFATELCSYRCLIPRDGFFPPKPIIRRNVCGAQCCIRSQPGCINISGFYITTGLPTFVTVGPSCPEFSDPKCPQNSILLDKKCGKICGPR